MFFTTGFFLWFFTVFITLYSLFYKNKNLRLSILIFSSLYFYYKCSGSFVFLLISVALADFLIARMMVISSRLFRKRLLRLSLLLNIGTLIYFKYTNFFLSVYGNMSGKPFEPLAIILPIGISFFTFQKLGYILDVYK